MSGCLLVIDMTSAICDSKVRQCISTAREDRKIKDRSIKKEGRDRREETAILRAPLLW